MRRTCAFQHQQQSSTTSPGTLWATASLEFEVPPPGVPVQLPLRVAAFEGVSVVSVAAGDGHMVALSASGVVFTWGDGKAGACGHGGRIHVAALSIVAETRRKRIHAAG